MEISQKRSGSNFQEKIKKIKKKGKENILCSKRMKRERAQWERAQISTFLPSFPLEEQK